ncbi:hypothetical protein K458DRAFT_407462 [Lentithecium fluviatile CBS 122367]|uniref:Uncharacterized protein n=1 Tax=Lentithecium fluviatile CBS 122367 TaxID=1168545 RepID=A0A6G1IPG5_9PLEO|nr:hypothetical protein K458DRAFT_407462 [Lentithecium fluviatile CBS 122367]
MPINWADQEVKDRLLAAIIASFDGPINCREIARLYGGEATYNAIENFLRKPKKKATELKAEAAGRDGPAPSPARPRAPKTPTKSSPAKSDGVKNGRVTKTKKNSSPIKKEDFAEDEVTFPTSSPVGDGAEDEV